MLRSAMGASVSVSVAELSVRFGSPTVAGTVTDATLARLPVVLESMSITTENVTSSPAAMSTIAERSPVPDAVSHDDPVDGMHVHEEIVAPAGALSVTVAPTT